MTARRRAARALAYAIRLAWHLFWIPTTLPMHVALRAAGGRGFLRKRPDGQDRYAVPWWAILTVAAICTAPLTLPALGGL